MPTCASPAQYDATSRQRESVIPSCSSRNKCLQPPTAPEALHTQGVSSDQNSPLRETKHVREQNTASVRGRKRETKKKNAGEGRSGTQDGQRARRAGALDSRLTEARRAPGKCLGGESSEQRNSTVLRGTGSRTEPNRERRRPRSSDHRQR